jgi:hypothetical protein
MRKRIKKGFAAMDVGSAALIAAITLGRQGYACFPCRFDKKPACPNGFYDASPDEVDLKKLWARYSGPLVGVATGAASQISVLDLDAKHQAARDWWAANQTRLLPTRMHRTRSGGVHLIYGHCEGLKCSISRICKGVDVRADGGYAIWWPAAGFPVLSDTPCTPWPDFLEYLAQPAPEPPPPPTTRTYSALPSPSSVEGRIIGLLNFVNDAPIGERNARLYWGACKIRDMVSIREVDDITGNNAFEALRQIGVQIGLPNWEVIRTIKSAASGRRAA